MDLLDKISRNGLPLAEYAGVKPLNGIKTGLNEAFLNDSEARRISASDPKLVVISNPICGGRISSGGGRPIVTCS